MLTDQGALLRRRDKTRVCLYTTGDMLGLGEQGRGLVELCGAASRPHSLGTKRKRVGQAALSRRLVSGHAAGTGAL